MTQFHLCFRVAFLAVLLPLTSGACVDFCLGMGSGTIPDSNINASSVQSASTPAKNGRLNYTSGSSWCAGTSDTNPYLQIDLQTLHIICAVSTQGNSQADQWVKTYTLQLSTDGTTWTDYKEGGQVKVLDGNKDIKSSVKHVLYGVLTRYLRFLPQTHQGEVCMRTEVFGVQQKPTCDSQAIGLASGGRIPDDSFSASSIFAPKYAAKYGRLNGRRAWEPKTTTDPDDYLQIDLLYEYVICAVATQGNPPSQSRAQEWTTEYKLRHSLNGTTFFTYKENKTDKAFPGNSGKTDTVKNSLKEFASAKFIRFLPTKYNNYKALRVEAYGILFTKVPSQPPTALKLTATSSTRIAASWQLPPVFARHGRNITGFKLFYKKKGFGGSVTTLAISRGSILSGNVTGLDKYTEYEFQVLAFTSDGDGPKSSVVVERTMEDVPSQAPESLTVTARTSTIVTASWQLPPLDSRNGIITGFKLFYKKKTASGSLAMLRIDNGAIHDKTVIGLDNNTEYEFQVLAFTSAGDGPKSSPVVVRTMKDGGCVDFYLGMGSGTIPDSNINASSIKSPSTPAENGRLNYMSGSSWCAGTSDTNPYLQIDLQTLHIICAVSTQGNSQANEWVKTYTLQLSTNGITWTNYKELGGQVKVLEGNKDRNSSVKHVLYGVLTRYLRFLPQTHQGEVCMRTEMFGVQQKPTCDSQAIGLASSGRIPDDSFSASSIFAPRYAAKYGRLNGRGAWEPKTTTDPDDYLQIDLLYEYVICAVATQGLPPTQSRAQEWTTEYKLRFSFNGTTFFPYREYKIDKAFPGNSGKTDTVKNSLKEFASAKFIRFLPTRYNRFKVLRVEAYGILFTKVPSQPPTAFKLTATSSTSIAASWKLPPVYARHATIKGFKLFYTEKGSGVSVTNLTISGESTFSRNVTGLNEYTEYAFQVLAFTSDGDGPKSSVEVERTMEDGGCVEFYLGMENGAIPDNKLTASTEQSANTPAKNGRVNYTSGSSWCARTSDTNPYLQIDLQTLHIICAVSTQGNSQADQWVKTYTLQLSTDEKVWTDYKELGGKVKVLEGNKDRNSNVKHVLYGVLTRYLRFLPQAHQGEVCMRTEVFGLQQKPRCDSQAIGLASGGRIPDDSFSASSIFKAKYAAKYGRLNGRGAWEPKTTTDPDEYLQIDLPYEYVICAVATQGNPPSNSRGQEWTTEYKLRFSLNGTTFFPYKENNTDKAFPGNKGKTDTVKNSLKEFASAKFIHFLPTKYNKFKALRVEAYGILFTKVPSQPPTAFQLTASSSTSITAFWQLPPVFARHGNIAGFKLFYKKKGSGGSATTLSINNGATLSRTVSGLDKFTEYEFQVLAFTSGGNGPKSSVKVKRTMEDAPSQPPSNFNVIPTSSTGVTASWQLPPANSRNGIIKGFKLFYKRKDSSGSGTILPINSESTLNKNVNGLYKYTEYEFQVLAFTSAGDGVNSSVIVNRTKEDVPSQPPRGFTLAATTSESITASWQLPPKDSRNGIIIGYKLFYKEKGSSGAGSSKLINSQATRSQEVIGLDKYTDYEFQILAFTSVGDGPKSTVVYEKTKEAAPSQPPSQFNVTVESSTSITASWRLPPEGSRHGIIKGYKLFYQKKGSDSETFLTLNNIKTSERVTKLDKYTEYEFQVLAFTSAGDGPNSSTVFKTTMQDAPDAPTSLSYTDVSPSKSHGPRITLTWSEPAERNGVIKSYTLFYSHDGVAPREISGIGKAALSHTVDVLGGVTYQFNIRAVTIKPGKNATKTVTTKEYAPGAGPELPSSAQVNKTTFNISWEPLLREKSYGKVILYEVKAIFLKKGNLRNRSVIYSPVNTSVTFVVLYDLELCSRYNVSVRAYTAEGPGPYGEPLELETSRPEAPGEFKVTDFGTKQITLAWKQYDEKEKIVYTVKYTGTKSYNKTFRDAEKTIEAIKATTQKVEGLIPGTTYEFSVHGNSVCGESASKVVSKMTDMIAPEAPFPHNITDVEVSHTAVDIYLWPVEQKYGPVSAYQVIVLKVAEGIEELPGDYGF